MGKTLGYSREYRARRAANGGRPLGRGDAQTQMTRRFVDEVNAAGQRGLAGLAGALGLLESDRRTAVNAALTTRAQLRESQGALTQAQRRQINQSLRASRQRRRAIAETGRRLGVSAGDFRRLIQQS